MTQDEAITKLESKGYKWQYRSEQFGFETLTKRNGFMTKMVEVDEDGTCNGLSLNEYLARA